MLPNGVLRCQSCFRSVRSYFVSSFQTLSSSLFPHWVMCDELRGLSELHLQHQVRGGATSSSPSDWHSIKAFIRLNVLVQKNTIICQAHSEHLHIKFAYRSQIFSVWHTVSPSRAAPGRRPRQIPANTTHLYLPL